MHEPRDKEVRFDLWCDSCKFKDKKESSNECDECLSYPMNTDSHKPVGWRKDLKK